MQACCLNICLLVTLLFSHTVASYSLRPHELWHARPPCPSPTPGVCSDSRPSCPWCHPTISSSVVPVSSCLQSFSASGSLPVSKFFTSCGQSIGVSASASVLPMHIQNWSPLERTGWISLQSKGLSRVFSNTTVQKYQFFGMKWRCDWALIWGSQGRIHFQADSGCWQFSVPCGYRTKIPLPCCLTS